MEKYAFLALSIDVNKLRYKMIESLYQHFTPEQIRDHNFYVICQGYSDEDAELVKQIAPDIHYFFTDRVSGSISLIRKTLIKKFDLFNQYEYVILTDDDFKYGPYSLEQYDHHIAEFDEHPEIGMIACQRQMKKDNRIQTSPIYTRYPQDLAAISMRNGLIIRSGIISPDEMFHDDIMYHEEFYLALQIYIKGYEIGKAWVDVYHQSRDGGLGNRLQKKYQIFTSNEAPSAKKIAYDQGLFSIKDGEIFYGAPNVGKVSKKAVDLHNSRKEMLGF